MHIVNPAMADIVSLFCGLLWLLVSEILWVDIERVGEDTSAETEGGINRLPGMSFW